MLCRFMFQCNNYLIQLLIHKMIINYLLQFMNMFKSLNNNLIMLCRFIIQYNMKLINYLFQFMNMFKSLNNSHLIQLLIHKMIINYLFQFMNMFKSLNNNLIMLYRFMFQYNMKLINYLLQFMNMFKSLNNNLIMLYQFMFQYSNFIML